ncbi:hypothetical protein GCM10023185_19300 [Hymenobacter saemangeumensis]|uniref:Uncharacterized protein n=1 Tax=Hymenobacter saemangeumensis TaxID=1084522 RepID=A0ABP8ICU7_9BACT
MAEAADGMRLREQNLQAGPCAQVPESIGCKMVEGQREIVGSKMRRGTQFLANGFESRNQLSGNFDAVFRNSSDINALDDSQQQRGLIGCLPVGTAAGYPERLKALKIVF